MAGFSEALTVSLSFELDVLFPLGPFVVVLGVIFYWIFAALSDPQTPA